MIAFFGAFCKGCGETVKVEFMVGDENLKATREPHSRPVDPLPHI